MEDMDSGSRAEQVARVDYETLEELLAKERQGKSRKLLIGLGAVVVVAGAGAAFALTSMSSQADAELQSAWNSTVTCLTGEAVLIPEGAARKVRAIQLIMIGLPEGKRGEPGQKVWPARCAAPALATAEAIKKSGKELGLREAASQLAKALDAPGAFQSDLSAPIERAFQEAKAAGLNATVGGDLPRPPAATIPLDQDGLEAMPRFLPSVVPLERVKLEPVPDGRLRFLIDDASQPGLPALCRFAPERRLLACKRLPDGVKKLSPGLMLWGTTEEGADPFLFAGERGKAGIFRSSDGARVAEGLTYGAFARKDGTLVRTTWQQERAEVWYSVLPKDGKARENKLLSYSEVGNPYYNSGLFWDSLVYKAGNPKTRELELYVRRVKENGELDALTTVGIVPEPSLIEEDDSPHIAACRTDEATVLRVKGRYHQFTAFYTDGRWTPPVVSPGTGGDLTCRKSEVTITDVWRNLSSAGTGRYWPSVLQNRCTPAACVSGTLTFKRMLEQTPDLAPVDKGVITAAELDGQLVLVWGAGERGGLRMKVAPMDRVEKAEARVIFDDQIESGKPARASTLIETRLVSSGSDALLFLSTGKGIYVFDVEKDGQLTPIKSSFE
jgi:hypothetical protein